MGTVVTVLLIAGSVVVYLGIGLGVAWLTGRLTGPNRDDDFDAAIPFIWPIWLPALLSLYQSRRGKARRVEVQQARAELEKEIRAAMPEVERILKAASIEQALKPEVGDFYDNVRQLTKGR